MVSRDFFKPLFHDSNHDSRLHIIIFAYCLVFKEISMCTKKLSGVIDTAVSDIAG